MRPTFSLLHPTARPKQWRNTACAWLTATANPDDVDYVLVPEWNVDVHTVPRFGIRGVYRNNGHPCLVDGFNTAAKNASGQVLIAIADDFFPFPRWDEALAKVIGTRITEDLVVWASTGGANDENFIVHPILTRSYLERYGYLFWSGYKAWYADNEFSDVAHRDGVVLDARKQLRFDHRHPSRSLAPNDEIYQRQAMQGEEARVLYERRKAQGFPR